MSTFSAARIKQMIMTSILMLIMTFINLMITKLYSTALLVLPLIIVFLYAYNLTNKENISLAISVFLYTGVFILSLMTWHVGAGLHDVVIGIYPMILIFTVLIGSMVDIIIVYLVSITAIILIGEMTIKNWYYIQLLEINYAYTTNLLLILILSGFIISIFSNDFKKTLSHLTAENKKLHESRKSIHYLAHYDHLTNLQNRSITNEQYKTLLKTIDFRKNQVIFYFIDLDNFKEINDLINHSAGDDVLIEVAHRLTSLTEPGDVICRLGGDEFLIIINRLQTFSTHSFTQVLLDKVTQPYFTHETELAITTSIGVAAITESGVDFDEACRRADLAMYKAKQQGKNTSHYYDDQLRGQSIRNAAIISGLKRAVKNDLLDLYFQPKINLQTEEIVGAEALLRWTKENNYKSSPQEFIPLIESSEIIIEIGEWVVRQACLYCKIWHNAGYPHMHVAVNISAIQLQRSNFKDIISSALADAHLSPHYLELELTEYLLLNKTDHTASQLESIKSMGVKLAIDDFGTGYSNLSYLTKFKVDSLKMDKSFIQHMNHSSKDLSIVTAIISMAHIINLSTVAEGIETEAEWKILQSLGCQYGQGYFWEKPLPHDEFMNSLKKYSHV